MAPRSREPEARRRLSLAALLSLVFHAIAVPLAVWLLFARIFIVPPQQPPETVTLSTAARLEKADRPLPPSIQKPAVAQQAQPKPRPTPRSRPPKPELSRQSPHAPPQPRTLPTQAPLAAQLARQQVQFERTARALHAENNPLSVATPSGAPAATHRRFINEMGQDHQETYFAILTPDKHWIDGDRSCYYTSYHMQTSAGGFEDGAIPWPVCYPKTHDAMLPLDRPHLLPVPLPPAGFVLAPGTYLTPFLKDIYEGHPGA